MLLMLLNDGLRKGAKMKFIYNFEIDEDRLAALVKNTRLDWIRKEILELDPDFSKCNEEFKYSYFLVFAAIGLFESGFDEKETLKILKDILRARGKVVWAPGNKKIH